MIIERYIFWEITQRLFWIAAILILVFSTEKFVDYLADAAAGKIPVEFVMKMLSLKLVSMQTEMLPAVMFLAVLLAFSRLNQDNELVIMSAAGIGKKRLLVITSIYSLLFCILVSAVAFFVAPWAKHRIDELKNEAWNTANITGIISGKFKELDKGNGVVYVEKLSDDKQAMENVFLQLKYNDRNSVLRSDSARFEIDPEHGSRYIVFDNGTRYVGEPGSLEFQITDYEKYGVLIQEGARDMILRSTEAMPTATLMLSPLPRHQAEFQWRLSALFICILLGLLAVLLNQYPFGQKKFTLVILAILIYFLYNNLLGISKSLVEREHLTPWIGLWWVHALLIIILLLIYHYPRVMKFKQGLFGSRTMKP